MITPNELRIGNWLQTPLQNPRGPYFEVNAADIKVISDYGTESSGIPLTPEILEKAGFVKDGFNAYNITLDSYEIEGCDYYKILYLQGDYLYIKEGTVTPRGIKEDIITLWNKDIMKEFYLHQLQNLFWSLCGKELEINL